MSEISSSFSEHPSRQAEVDPGAYLLHGYSDRQLTDITVTRYKLEVEGGLKNHWNRMRFTSSAAYYLDKTHGTPVAADGTLTVISMTALSRSVSVWGKQVTPVKDTTLNLDLSRERDRTKLRTFVQSCLRRAIPSKEYSFQFLNKIVRSEEEFSTDQFAAHPKHKVKIQITADGTVLAHVESGYAIRSKSTLDELYSLSDEPTNVKVAHYAKRYSTQGQGRLQGWSEYSYNDHISNAGASVAEMHKGTADEEWRQKLIDEDPRLLKIKYGDNVRNQAPHFLKLAPRTEEVKDQDYEFHREFVNRRAMMPDEKFEYAKEFFDALSRLPSVGIEFQPGPTNHQYDRLRIRDQSQRLTFADNQFADTPSKGLRNYGVHKNPGNYRIGVLTPNRWENLREEFIPLIVQGLTDLDAPAAVTGYGYNLGDISNYTPIAHDLHEGTDAVIAVVPDDEQVGSFPGIEDPHHELKRTMMRQGIATQMVRKPTVDELVKARAGPQNDKMLNILSAVVAKAGGTPWQINQIPGQTDAFMGLDVSRDQSSGQHTGASASVVLADGTTFAAESTVQQGGEKFSARHVRQFIRDLVFDFAAQQGHEINRLCIMRDGKVQEDIDAVRNGLSELNAEIDIVGIRKRGQPRIAEFNGTRFRIADKGIAFVDELRDQAIVHAFGKPETWDDNSVGTPQTFRLMRHSGPTDVETLARQSYWLSEVHVGSPVRSSRLPIPIIYSDMAAEYVRDDIVSAGTVIEGPAYI